MIFSSSNSNGKTILFLLGLIAAIALVAFIIYKAMKRSDKTESIKKPTQEEVIKEEMDRILCPIEDEELSKKINEYKDEE